MQKYFASCGYYLDLPPAEQIFLQRFTGYCQGYKEQLCKELIQCKTSEAYDFFRIRIRIDLFILLG
jgi:hypothetical protein